MGLFPPLPGDDGQEHGRHLSRDEHESYHGLDPPESAYEWWVLHVCELYPEAATVEEAVAMLEADAEKILEDVTPYTWGQATEPEELGDPVEWAEQITKAEAVKRAAEELDGLHQPYIPPSPSKRLSVLSRAEERAAVHPTRKALNELLRAAKALRRAVGRRLRRYA
jgi:hypothetical protein